MGLNNLQLIAMHGWAGDHRAWAPWQVCASQRGWSMNCGERGYGRLAPQVPAWGMNGGRAVMVHSLGLHLLHRSVLERAEAVVLLASFAGFLPKGAAGRPLRQALRSMNQRLERGEADALLRDFLAEAAWPEAACLMPAGPLEDGLPPAGQQRLRDDLRLLTNSSGLPEGFPAQAAVLVVEAEADRIVAAESRLALREALPGATVWCLAGVGHSLLATNLLGPVLDWLEQTLDTPTAPDG